MSVSINIYGIAEPISGIIEPRFFPLSEVAPDDVDEGSDSDTPSLDFGDGGASAAVITGTKAQWQEFVAKLAARVEELP